MAEHTDTERLDFMLAHWGKFGGGVHAHAGQLDEGHEARITWIGWDSYGREGHFITFADDSRTAIDLALDEATAMRGEDWEESWPEWMLTHEKNRARRPDNITSYERFREREGARERLTLSEREAPP